MAEEVFADWIRESTSTTGAGTITLGGATDSSFMAISDSSIADGDLVPYSIIDGNDRENGIGTYTASGTTLARTTVLSTWVSGVYDDTAPTAISLTGNAIVFVDINSFQAMSKRYTVVENELIRSGATLNGTTTGYHVCLDPEGTTGAAALAYDYITISGGKSNTAIHRYATVGGGQDNDAKGQWSAIGGGQWNIAGTGSHATVAGGNYNQATGVGSFCGGGSSGVASGTNSSVTSGASNTGSSTYSFVPGGRGNTSSHTHAGAMCGGSATRGNFDVVIGATDTATASTANNTIRFQGTGGNIKADGSLTTPEADYAEMFEWYDGNPNNEDRIGRFVSIHDGKIVMGAGRADKTGLANYLASAFTDPNSPTTVPMLGVVSGMPGVIGDGAPNKWSGVHVRDKFKRKSYKQYIKKEWINEDNMPEYVYVATDDGKVYDEYPQYSHTGMISAKVVPESAEEKEVVAFPEVNPLYDHSAVYVPRHERQEWDAIGLIGKLIVKSAEPITSDYVRSSQDGRALNATVDNGIARVLRIIDNYTVEVFYK